MVAWNHGEKQSSFKLKWKVSLSHFSLVWKSMVECPVSVLYTLGQFGDSQLGLDTGFTGSVDLEYEFSNIFKVDS